MPTNYGGMMYGNPNENFTIEKEDFPALPGSQKHGDSGPSTSGLHAVTGRDLGLVGGGAAGAAGSIGSTQHTQQQQQQQSTTQSNDYSGGVFSSPVFERSNGINITGILSAGITAAGSGSGSTATTTATTGSSENSSLEVRYGLGGLLDIMRMSDKVRNSSSSSI